MQDYLDFLRHVREHGTRKADLLPVTGNFNREVHVGGITALLDRNEADFLRSPREWAEARFAQVQAVGRISTWAARAAEWEALLAPAVRA